MPSRKTGKRKAEFGDFQTPAHLAQLVCKLLRARLIPRPASVVEPTCGRGSFLLAALHQFPSLRRALATEINEAYVKATRTGLVDLPGGCTTDLIHCDFFGADWLRLLKDMPEPILVIGNPPWVTSAELGALGSSNVPEKTNFQRHNGLDAITGKSNFDISEWMLIHLLQVLNNRQSTLAMLCKTTVARRVLCHAWKSGLNLERAEMRRFDAASAFGASVDACLLVCTISPCSHNLECQVYQHLTDETPVNIIGYREGQLVAEVGAFERLKHLQGREFYRWRSGIKHDCSKVMELSKEGHRYRNGLGELVDLERHSLYPLLKGSDVAKGQVERPTRWMVVPQQSVGDETSILKRDAPKTWRYLQSHAQILDRRASSIYANRPRFSIFGVGDYSFAPYKVAIPGLYKALRFRVLGKFAKKPIVLDDTAYFLPCKTAQEAEHLATLLNSGIARQFFEGFVFWDAKRPITIEVLRRLDLRALARELGSEATFLRNLSEFACGQLTDNQVHFERQLALFE